MNSAGLADSTDLLCPQCGYDLRGLSDRTRCPECNGPIAYAEMNWPLRFSDLGWMRRVRRGLNLVACGVIGPIPGSMLLAGGGAVIKSFAAVPGWLAGAAFSALFLAAGLCVTIGVWMATSPDPAAILGPRALLMRWIARAWLVPIALQLMLGTQPWLTATIPPVISTAAWILTVSASLNMLFAGLALYASLLAREIGSEELHVRLRTRGWFFLIASAVILLITLLGVVERGMLVCPALLAPFVVICSIALILMASNDLTSHLAWLSGPGREIELGCEIRPAGPRVLD